MEKLVIPEIVGVKSVVPLFAEKEEKGIAKISRFFYKYDHMFELRTAMRSGKLFTIGNEGHYCRLVVNNELMMSDTPMERKSNLEFIKKANGKVFIAGLGLGLIIQAVLEKPEVTEVIVIEKYQDVIDLVAPKFSDKRLKVICADILEYKPKKDEIYDVIYFDIWPEISSDNLYEIRMLHNRFKSRLNRKNPNFFMDSWMKKLCQKFRRKETDNCY